MIVNTSQSATPAGIPAKRCWECGEHGEWSGQPCPSCSSAGIDERQMRQLLVDLEMISHGSTQAWNSDGRGGNDQAMPPGELRPPHLYYRAEWANARNDRHRRDLVRQARDELRSITNRTTVVVGLSEREIIRANVLDCGGWLDTEVAARYRYTVRQVREIRVKNERTAERGEQIEGLGHGVSRAEWAATLKAQGLTESVIAKRLGVSQPTVNRLLNARRIDHRAA